MTSIGVLQIAIFFGLILVCTKPLGAYMARVFEGQRTFIHPVLRWLEVFTYKVIGVKEDVEQRWTTYTAALLSFSIFGFLLTYLVQRLQGFLPFNPQHFSAGNVPPDLAFNTATSFVTNTNWQAYSGESTHELLRADGGPGGAELRFGGRRNRSRGRLDPRLCPAGEEDHRQLLGGRHPSHRIRSAADLDHRRPALCFAGCGSELQAYTEVTTVEGAKQVIAQGPVASQEAIKQLGTNGGGFFNANSAHPFENPTPLSNLLAMFLIFVIPGALTYTFGKMVGDTRQGWAIFAAFSVMFLIGVFVCYHFEQAGNPMVGEPWRPNRREFRSVRRKYGGQGDPIRDRQFRPVRHSNYRCELWRGEQHGTTATHRSEVWSRYST